jgi:S1-C subfamily serine protease
VSSIRRDSLELDLPIIPGESGGPVFDAFSGAVIGLAESRFDDEKAIGFGVPIEDAKALLKHRLHAPS